MTSRVLGPDDLVLTGSTLGNPPLADLVAAAAGAGFAGLSLWPAHVYAPAREAGRPPDALRAMVDDAGLVVQDVDALIAWVGPDDPGPPYFEEPPEALLFETAEVFGARFVNVLLAGPKTVSLEDKAEVLADVCDRAAEHGLVATFEFSVRSLIGTLGEAVALVEACGRPNAGVMLDTWHFHWTGATLDELRAVPTGTIRAVQVNDAPAEPPENLPWATRYHRLVPGTGAIDLPAFVRTLAEIGCDAPLTVEVFNDEELAAHGVDGFARRCGDAVRGIQSAARARH